MQELGKLNPNFTPATPSKVTEKLYIPIKDYPNYNFMGLIIGPRGNTQKQLEKETKCRISIRGKGSHKEGRAKRHADDDDEMHVLVTADNEDDLKVGVDVISKLLVPIEDDEANEWKQKQLRELALINGTLRDDEYCQFCGEKGHRQFECPKRVAQMSAKPQIRCSICGDASHITSDCPVKGRGGAGGPAHSDLDREYQNFMAELGEGSAPPPSSDDGDSNGRGLGRGGGAGRGGALPPRRDSGPGGMHHSNGAGRGHLGMRPMHPMGGGGPPRGMPPPMAGVPRGMQGYGGPPPHMRGPPPMGGMGRGMGRGMGGGPGMSPYGQGPPRPYGMMQGRGGQWSGPPPQHGGYGGHGPGQYNAYGGGGHPQQGHPQQPYPSYPPPGHAGGGPGAPPPPMPPPPPEPPGPPPQ